MEMKKKARTRKEIEGNEREWNIRETGWIFNDIILFFKKIK